MACSPLPHSPGSLLASSRSCRISLLLAALLLPLLTGCSPGPETRLIGVWQGKPEISPAERDKLDLWLESVTIRVPNLRRIEIERNLTRDGKSWQESETGSWEVLQDRNDKLIIKMDLIRDTLALEKELAITFDGPNEILVTLVVKRTTSST